MCCRFSEGDVDKFENDWPYGISPPAPCYDEQAGDDQRYLSAVATIKDRLLQVRPEMAEPIERLLIQIAA